MCLRTIQLLDIMADFIDHSLRLGRFSFDILDLTEEVSDSLVSFSDFLPTKKKLRPNERMSSYEVESGKKQDENG